MKIRLTLRVVLFNLALFAALMETAALCGYYYRTGKIYYLDTPTGRSAPTDLENVVEDVRLHPYFGYIGRPAILSPGVEQEIHYNNFGFWTPLDYPYGRRRPQEYLVGIFGGSAALNLAVFEARERILAGELAEALGRDPEDVTTLNFAQGGFKQPQQLLIHEYFRAIGQELDLVINFDGFNDVVLASRNAMAGVRVDMPSIDHVRALQEVTAITQSPDGVERMLRARRYWARYSRMYNRAWAGEGWELSFASGFMIDWLIYRRYRELYFASRLEVAGLDGATVADSWLYLNPSDAGSPGESPEAAIGRIVELWANASLMLNRAARDHGAEYLHFVQPNQYHPTARTFSEAERRLALNPRSPFADLVLLGYPQLEAELERLRRQGVAAEGLFRLLDDVEETVYADDCCHFSDAGQRVLLRHIGRAAAAVLLEHDEPQPMRARHP